MRRTLTCAALVVVALALAPEARSGGYGITVPPPEPNSLTYGPGWPPTCFYRVQVGQPGSYRRRDLEFWWDSLYTAARGEVGVSGAILATLDSLGVHAFDARGANPLGADMTDIQLTYDYVQPLAGFRYDSNPFATYGFEIGTTMDTSIPTGGGTANGEFPVPPADRQHLDLYLYPAGHSQRYRATYGEYPSLFWTQKEDSATGHWRDAASFEVFHYNSIMDPGPRIDLPVVDTTGTGWTRLNGQANWAAAHEFEHSLRGSDLNTDLLQEMFSSAAEALVGNGDRTATYECPSTWTVFGRGPNGLPNYQALRAFSEYLAYDFRGQDHSSTWAGFQDDLLFKWSHSSRWLTALDSLLRFDASCYECPRYYSGEPDPELRLLHLIQDWRVANYVNAPSLDQGQYGYPPESDFAPAVDLRAWQLLDAVPCNDHDAVPIEVTVTSDWREQSHTFTGTRQYTSLGVTCTADYELVPSGAQYWVVRSDASLAGTAQDLIVRVDPQGIRNYELCLSPEPNRVSTLRLAASVVPYAEQALPGGEPDSLWKHPEWARAPLPTQWVEIDSAATPLEFRVPAFGTSTKAALVVITLADGPAHLFLEGFDGGPAIPYRLSLALRDAAMDTLDNRLALRNAGTADDHPAWSPTGNELLAEATVPEVSARPQIYRVPLWQGGITRLVAQDADQHQPDWSPRGDWVAFEAESTLGVSHVWLHQIATGVTRRLTSRALEEHSPAFRPDGQQVAYASFGVLVGGTLQDVWEIRRASLDGTNDASFSSPLTLDRPQALRWSADGATLYFTRNDTLFSLNATGGAPVARTELFAKVRSVDTHPVGWRLVAEQPGAYTTQRLVRCDSIITRTPFPFAYRRLVLRDATGDHEPFFYRTSAEFWNPRWSPDGVSIAYSTDRNAAGDRDLYVGRVSYDHPPRFSPEPLDANLTTADTLYTTTLVASDPDGQPVSYSAAFLPPGGSLSGAVFTWSHPAPGTHFVVFRVTDGTGGVHSKVVRYDVTSAPGGGGGCPFADTRTAGGWQVENSLLSRSLSSTLALDAYRLKHAPLVESDQVTLRLRENEQEYTVLDQVRLVAVDHDPALHAYADGEHAVLATRVAAARVVDQHGTDVTALVDGLGDDYYVGEPGDTLWVSMSPSRPQGATGIERTLDGEPGEIDDGGKGGGGPHLTAGGGTASAGSATEEQAMDAEVLGTTGILIQVPDGAGDWRTLETRYPRAEFDEHLLDSLGTSDLRLVFVGTHRVRFLGRLANATTVTPQPLTLRAAVHSQYGDVRAALAAVDDVTTALSPGDTLTLRFDAAPVPPGQVRDWLLLNYGVYSANRAVLQRQASPASLPVRFVLRPARPNPFAHTTTIGFELPRECPVTLEVFDVGGRRIATLTHGTWPAGIHAVTWDRRRDDGGLAQPGVYLYRLTAGVFSARRKLVLMP